MFRNVRQVIVLSCELFYLRNMSVKLIGKKKKYYFVKAIKVMIAWDQAPHFEKKEKKLALAKRKKSASEASREVVSLGSLRSPIIFLFDRAPFFAISPTAEPGSKLRL